MYLLLLVVVCVFEFVDCRYPYDHMNHTYYAQPQFKPLELQNYKVSLIPVFSPDHSIETLTNLVNSAEKSIDIMQPYFSSWLDDCYYGCSPQEIHDDEPFPIFQVLLNKVHQGLQVRIITNDYESTLDQGDMDLLTYLQVAGADVRSFDVLPYTHAKLIIIDGNVICISSINFSETSFMDNRESGLIVKDIYEDSASASKYVQSVFDFDFERGYVKKLQDYSPEDISLCKNKTILPFVIPTPKTFPCNSSSPTPTESVGENDLTFFISPDYAYNYIINASLNEAKEDMKVFIYSIEPNNMCDAILGMNSRDLSLTVFVSAHVYSSYETKSSYKCYVELYDNNITVRKTDAKCLSYYHNKYWLVDETDLFVSTGNWEDIDIPRPPYVFPPYWTKEYRRVQRDYHVMVRSNSQVNQAFKEVFITDFDQGYNFKPN